MQSDYLSQSTTVFIQHLRTSLITEYKIFPSDYSSASKALLSEYRKFPRLLNANRPDLATEQAKNTNFVIVLLSLERMLDVMAASQMLQLSES